MTNSTVKTSTTKSAIPSQTAESSDIGTKHLGTNAAEAAEDNVAQATFGKVKDAVPSVDDMTAALQDQTNIDFQNIADDAATFVRRNPALSLAAAAGIGLLVGILANKRS